MLKKGAAIIQEGWLLMMTSRHCCCYQIPREWRIVEMNISFEPSFMNHSWIARFLLHTHLPEIWADCDALWYSFVQVQRGFTLAWNTEIKCWHWSVFRRWVSQTKWVPKYLHCFLDKILISWTFKGISMSGSRFMCLLMWCISCCRNIARCQRRIKQKSIFISVGCFCYETVRVSLWHIVKYVP